MNRKSLGGILLAVMMVSMSSPSYAGLNNILCNIHGYLSGHGNTEQATANGCETPAEQCSQIGGNYYTGPGSSTPACLSTSAYNNQVAVDNCQFPNTVINGSCATPQQACASTGGSWDSSTSICHTCVSYTCGQNYPINNGVACYNTPDYSSYNPGLPSGSWLSGQGIGTVCN